MSGKVFKLRDEQAQAVDPQQSVWLSASAGTGKTQVLSARVLRLLLQEDVDPAQILCLTFTKAGAAEMATRVNEVLASWVRMPDIRLAQDLQAIGAAPDPATLDRARTLFASVLDCPGGGLRIDTIHAFSQWLLAAFPGEAQLQPGTRPMEDRERDLLAHSVLSDLVAEWERQGEGELLAALATLAVRWGPDGVRKWFLRCAAMREAWFGPAGWQPPLEPRLRRLLGLREDETVADLASLCEGEAFDEAALKQCLAACRAWGTATGTKIAESAEEWLSSPASARADLCEALQAALFTKDLAPRSLNSLRKHDPKYKEAADRVLLCLRAVAERRMLIQLLDLLVPALDLGRRFAIAWEAAKEREGLIDFDDQIRRAADLLNRSDLSEWIRYKLDRRFDHVLVDEAQDTNAAQWSIIRALTGDFFAGHGQHDDKLRTLFVVGDYKQAIFRFQGTSPKHFETARRHFEREIRAAVEGAEKLRKASSLRDLLGLGLGRSYRSAQPVLDFVDEAVDAIGFENFGLERHPGRHEGDERPGVVAMWPPIGAERDEDPEDDGPEGWVSEPERRMADRIAEQVREWLDEGYPLAKGEPRLAGPGDIMVLVRKRRELAGLIVARLHAANVPVAGVDRLRLGAPLAVKDLMAALRFAAQPLDDLSLANLLVSPLIGWSQDELLELGWREKGGLWDHLRRHEHPRAAETAERLRDLLRLADFEPPQALLHWLLVGPWQGRRRLLERLGREAADPIDELLAAAEAFAAAHTPSLQGFIQWFDAGEGELKRDSGVGGNLVRVMTVHGSKGLQAPIVILADATGNPDAPHARPLSLIETLPGGEGREIPVPTLRKDERVGPIASADAQAEKEEREEHWRLLYVAMTRAEEALYIGGALGKREKAPAADSWYARLQPLFTGDAVEDPVWGERWQRGSLPERPTGKLPEPAIRTVEIPAWARRPVGAEPRPPRPLAPSAAGEEMAADPPHPPGSSREAARRGVILHRLLERLPEIAPDGREEAARAWLERQAPDIGQSEREAMLSSAITVLAEPAFAPIFSPAALAEVPLAATVGEQVIAGTADRLLVEEDRVLVVDFKTTGRPPRDLDSVPPATLRQMAAYAAALETIFPGRSVEAALLYTQTPQLIAIPAEVLASHKAALSPRQESLARPPVE